MMTVRATPLDFIRSCSVSGVASRSGTLAPSAKGKAGSCFHTWTWGSRMRVSAPASRVRRVTSDIDGLQFVDDVLGAPFVAGPRALAGDVEIHAQPALETDRFQYAMAAREIDRAIAEVEDVVLQLAGVLAGVLVVEEHEAVLVLVDDFDHIAIGQIEVG